MSSIEVAVLTTLIKAACNLHEASLYETGEDPAAEYTCGQAELIAAACGIPAEVTYRVLQPLLSSGKSHHDIRRAVMREIKPSGIADRNNSE
ncbi:MAG TPA: hypothetical protein VGG75_37920 [Trebonia sp.]|jgi:hypothetical protein